MMPAAASDHNVLGDHDRIRSRRDQAAVAADDAALVQDAVIDLGAFLNLRVLHDDGILYAEKLRVAGIAVEVNETKGTMHGFDIAQKAQTTKSAVATRIEYMKRMFKKNI